MVHQRVINCATHDQWVSTIAALVREGLTFEAEVESDDIYRIILTGGY